MSLSGQSADPATASAVPTTAPRIAHPHFAAPNATGPNVTGSHVHDMVHGLPEAVSSLLRTIVVALFVLSFIAQPMFIPSESMERTLLVGDFLLMNRVTLAPAGLWSPLLPYQPVERGQIVTFRSPVNPSEYLVKRVIGLPGDRLHISGTILYLNNQPVSEPWATFEPVEPNPFLTHFPTSNYTDPGVEPAWWKLMQASTRSGDLLIPPGKYFMLGDNRNHSRDSRYWGFVSRADLIAQPFVIYFSLNRSSPTENAPPPIATPSASASTTPPQPAASPTNPPPQSDKLSFEAETLGRVQRFARWNRFFHVVH